jgi:hypothetical protein
VINEQIGVFDIFVGIMWKRFGTPTGEAHGGTEEEFRLALTRWAARRQPHIMFYFSSAQSAPPTTSEEVEQLSKVVAFRTELSKKALVWSYAVASQFAEVVRPHLASTIGQMIRAIPPASQLRTEPTAARERLQLEIIEIAPEDAYYAGRDKLIGKLVVPHSLTITGDGWSGGLMEFDEPPLENEGHRISLFRFRWLAQL